MSEDGKTDEGQEVTVRRSKDGKEPVIELEGASIVLHPDGIVINGAQIKSCCLGPDGRFHIAGRIGDRNLSGVTGSATTEVLPNLEALQ